MWQWVARGNIQQISYILQTEQHEPEGRMLLCLGNVPTMCVYVCMCVCMHVCVCMYVGIYVCMYIFATLNSHLQSVPDYSFNLAQSHWGIHRVGEREEKKEGLPALYLGKLSLWTLQQERGKSKNGF